MRLTDEARDRAIAEITALIAAYRDDSSIFPADDVARIILPALADVRVRDDAWSRMDPDHVAAHEIMWLDLAARARPGEAAPPLTLLAFTHWQANDHAAALAVLTRAFAAEPRYSMARLLWGPIAARRLAADLPLPMTPEQVADAYARRVRS